MGTGQDSCRIGLNRFRAAAKSGKAPHFVHPLLALIVL